MENVSIGGREKRIKKKKKRIKQRKKEKLAAPVVALGSDSWSWAWVEATSCLIPFAMPCAALMSVNIKRSGVITISEDGTRSTVF